MLSDNVRDNLGGFQLGSFFLLPITSMRVLSVHNSPREFTKKGLINQAKW